MEDRLKRLVEAGDEGNRAQAAREWKAQGKKVMGYTCAYVPEEVIEAAGMLPWRIMGTGRENAPLALVYRPVTSCSYCTTALESFLQGEMEFLDGVVATNSCGNMRRLWDVFVHTKQMPFAHILELPHLDNERAYKRYERSIDKFVEAVEDFAGVKISDEALSKAVAVHNKSRALLRQVNEWRKRDVPPVTGSEALGLAMASMVMPKEEFNKELEALLPYLEERKISAKHLRPRILLSGSIIAERAHLDLIEDVGGLVVMDDLCTGSRYFWDQVDTSVAPRYGMAKYHITKPACARMAYREKYVDKILDLYKEYNADGIIQYILMYCDPWLYSVPTFEAQLHEAGVPFSTIMHEHYLTSQGQLRTRVEAFAEMLALEV